MRKGGEKDDCIGPIYDPSVQDVLRNSNRQQLEEKQAQDRFTKELTDKTKGLYKEVFVCGFPKGFWAEHLVQFLGTKLEAKGLHDHIAKCKLLIDEHDESKRGAFVVMTTKSALALEEMAANRRLVYDGDMVIGIQIKSHEPDWEQIRAGLLLSYEGGTVSLGGWSGPFELSIQWEKKTTNIIIQAVRKTIEWHVNTIHGDFMVEIPLTHLQKRVLIEPGSMGDVTLILYLRWPPKIYRKKTHHSTLIQNDKSSSDEDLCDESTARKEWSRVSNEDKKKWIRTTDFTRVGDPSSTSVLGSCLVHRLNIPISPFEMVSLIAVFSDLGLLYEDKGFSLTTASKAKQLNIVKVKGQDWERQRAKCAEKHKLSFKVMYTLEMLVAAGKVSAYELVDSSPVWKLLIGVNEDTAVAVLNTVLSQWVSFDMGYRTAPHFAVDLRAKLEYADQIVQLARCSQLKDEDLGHYTLIKKVLLTPTRMAVMPPELDISNRVLRKYPAYADRFIRVVVVDEEFDKPLASELRRDVRHRYRETLRNGVTVGNRLFTFLAFSSSQLRQGSMWFFSGTPDLNVGKILKECGDFESIKTVARRTARIGQCFSGTVSYGKITDKEICEVPDVVHPEKKSYIFSDGVGKIHPTMAANLASTMGLDYVPSAFQVRIGGGKGVLTVHHPMPLDPRGGDWTKICVRPSMMKFKTKDKELDIITYAHWMPAYLNTQLITILETLGVNMNVFLDLQDEYLNRLDGMLDEVPKARTMVKMIGGDSPSAQMLLSMMEAGFEPSREMFLRDQLLAMRAYSTTEVLLKARVLITKGSNLMGVMDETNKLEYGEVFVRVRRRPSEEAKIIEGPVLVSKSPMLHPGDVRMLNAVRCPELEVMGGPMGLENVIVFPQKGKRPHPNEMSGSDLDGDIYIVVWDERLFPPVLDEPMEFPEKLPDRKTGTNVTPQEIQKFFLFYLRHDNLGMLSMAHLAFADSSFLGARDPKCLELARLVSVAVDFAKTGINCDHPPALRPKKWPDFMQKENKPEYLSKKALGCMYRRLKEKNEAVVPTKESHDPDLVIEGYETYMNEARLVRDAFEWDLWRIITVYGVYQENEAVSGFLPMLIGKGGKKKHAETQEKLMMEVRALQSRYCHRFWSDLRLKSARMVKNSQWDRPTFSFDPRILQDKSGKEARREDIQSAPALGRPRYENTSLNSSGMHRSSSEPSFNEVIWDQNPNNEGPRGQGQYSWENNRESGSGGSTPINKSGPTRNPNQLQSKRLEGGGAAEIISNCDSGSNYSNNRSYNPRTDTSSIEEMSNSLMNSNLTTERGHYDELLRYLPELNLTDFSEVEERKRAERGKGRKRGPGTRNNKNNAISQMKQMVISTRMEATSETGWGAGSSTLNNTGGWGVDLTGPNSETKPQTDEERWESWKKASAWYQ
eukprot:Ihof_evm1s946 gene=Ihof_evmTU1s946